MRLPDWLGFRGKTLWDWLQLLIVPTILIAITFAWSATQTRSDNKREDRRSQDVTLQAYLDQMSSLMLSEKLLTSKERDPVRAVARTVTLTALRRLDGERKGEVVRFLSEALLIDKGTLVKRRSLVDLRDADLAGADLVGADLVGADLTEANLTGADLRRATLFYADLTGAKLDGAIFTGASLNDADLTDTNFEDAILTDANLDGVKGMSEEEIPEKEIPAEEIPEGRP